MDALIQPHVFVNKQQHIIKMIEDSLKNNFLGQQLDCCVFYLVNAVGAIDLPATSDARHIHGSFSARGQCRPLMLVAQYEDR